MLVSILLEAAAEKRTKTRHRTEHKDQHKECVILGAFWESGVGFCFHNQAPWQQHLAEIRMIDVPAKNLQDPKSALGCIGA